MTAGSGRPPRADARRNRAILLKTAEAVFAAKGTSASTEEVARAAGVGVGTLFRHFPTKEALLAAVYRQRLARLAEAARTLGTAEDPGTAFFDFLADAVANSSTKVALAEALAEAGVDADAESAEVVGELRRALTALLVAAQRDGAVRVDVGLPELTALLIGASRAAAHARPGELRARVIALCLDGLRPRVPAADSGSVRANRTG